MIKNKRTRSSARQKQAFLEQRRRREVLEIRIALGVLLIVILLIGYRVLNATILQVHASLGDEILGTWQNSDGYQIQFRPGGTGFIPGVPGQIPDSTFVYSILDGTHIQIDLQGHRETIELLIAGDRLTWKDALGEVIYERVK